MCLKFKGHYERCGLASRSSGEMEGEEAPGGALEALQLFKNAADSDDPGVVKTLIFYGRQRTAYVSPAFGLYEECSLLVEYRHWHILMPKNSTADNNLAPDTRPTAHHASHTLHECVGRFGRFDLDRQGPLVRLGRRFLPARCPPEMI